MDKNAAVKKTVRICTLGGFSITVDRVTVSETINRSNRIWNLLAYMLIHREKDIPQSELIETIWPDDDSSNPVNTLKTLVYRVRSMLSESFGEDFQLITSQRGSYSLNNEYEYIIDVDEYEELVEASELPSLSTDERLALYEKACDLYVGDFLPRLSTEMWTIPLSMHYHSMHLDLVKTYAELLLMCSRYRDVVELCTSATSLDAYDEDLHALIIRAYAKQGNESAAISHYQSSTDMLYRNLGVRPSETLREIYLEIMEGSRNLETDLSIITDTLREECDNDGAFFCDYGFFRMAFRLESRRAARAATCVHVALITVATRTGSLPPLDVLNDTMEQLLGVLHATLRKGDIVSRYNGAQFILLLPSANYEDSEMVVGRVVENFKKKFPKNKLQISFKLQQLDCVL